MSISNTGILNRDLENRIMASPIIMLPAHTPHTQHKNVDDIVTRFLIKTLHQWSISPTFYKQHLCQQSQKALKDSDDLTVFFCSWDSSKHADEIDP